MIEEAAHRCCARSDSTRVLPPAPLALRPVRRGEMLCVRVRAERIVGCPCGVCARGLLFALFPRKIRGTRMAPE
jgi:hypothetical protein